jgi:serine/threonine-protein kinase RsbW
VGGPAGERGRPIKTRLFAGLRMGVAGSSRREDSNPPRSTDRGRNNGKRSRSNHLVFTIPSELAAGRDVQNQILDDVREKGFSGNDFFAINLALEEALTNAIRHGNRLDPNKKVRVEAKVTSKRVEILIEDEGPGFDRGSIPDPTAQENLEKCSGRGILLIEAYMSSVSWDHGGRRLRMIKLNDSEPSSK